MFRQASSRDLFRHTALRRSPFGQRAAHEPSRMLSGPLVWGFRATSPCGAGVEDPEAPKLHTVAALSRCAEAFKQRLHRFLRGGILQMRRSLRPADEVGIYHPACILCDTRHTDQLNSSAERPLVAPNRASSHESSAHTDARSPECHAPAIRLSNCKSRRAGLLLPCEPTAVPVARAAVSGVATATRMGG